MSAVCLGCDKPIATAAQWADIPEGEGTHLCWSLDGCHLDVVQLRDRITTLAWERDEARARVAELEEALRKIEECAQWRPIIVEHLPAGPGVCASDVGRYGPWLGHIDHLGERHGWVRIDPDQPTPTLPRVHSEADPVYMAEIARTALGKEKE